MKKIFSLFAAILFAGSMLAASLETVKSVFTSATPVTAGAVTDTAGVVTWTVATTVGQGTPAASTGTASSISCLKFGSSGSNYFSRIEFTTDYYKNHKVDSINFYIRNNGKKTGTFTAIQGADTIGVTSKEFGAEWVVLTAKGKKGQGGTLKLIYEVAQASYWSYIEVTYEPGEAPSCTNTVAITKGDEVNGTFALSATEVCGDGEGEDVSVLSIVPAAGYVFGEITTSASGTVDNENKKVTGITAATTIGVVFNEIPKYTVSFSTGEGNPTVDPVAEEVGGQGIELPAGPTPVCADWTFAGWAAAAVAAETTEAPALLKAGANYKPADNVTLHAVYKRSESGEVAKQSITETFENQTDGTTYNTTVNYDADASVVGLAWTMYYGTVSTNDKVAGSKSAQMRWYASATDALGYIETKTAIGGLDTISFKMRVSNVAVKGALWYSTDGADWTLLVDTFACPSAGAGGVTTFKTVIGGATDKSYYVRLGVSSKGTAPGSSSYKLLFDDIQFDYVSATVTTYYLSAPTCAPAHTYSLVGPLSPAGWDEKSNLGDMTLNEGVYSITVEDVILTKATSYEYKIVEDHAWTVAFPQEGNAAFTVEKSGKYDVTFTLNASTKAYAANPVLKEEIAVKHKFAVLGGFNSWSADATEVDEDAATAEFVVNIAEAANFEFKVKVNDAWLANGYTYHRDFTGAAGITANGDNMVLTADVAGDYTFTWTFETNALEITFPAKGPGTGIEETIAEGKAVKVVRNGQVLILKGDKTFNVIGQIVK